MEDDKNKEIIIQDGIEIKPVCGAPPYRGG